MPFSLEPAGTSSRSSATTGMIVTAMSIITVPATVGVMILRSSDSRAASSNWKSEEAMSSVIRRPGPPSVSAVTHTAMNAPEVTMRRMYPEPILPTRPACIIVVIPEIPSAAKAAHAR